MQRRIAALRESCSVEIGGRRAGWPHMRNSDVLYGWHLSYFSGKVRCYLQHKNISFTDAPVDLWTLTRAIKQRFGIPVMPVVVTPEGEWLQDSSVIIDRLEETFSDRSVIPASRVQRFAAYLLETWGDEWWTPIAMHTRWSFPENYALFEQEAGQALLPRFPRFIQRIAVALVARQLRSYLPRVGIVPEQFAIMDGWTVRVLDHLEAHFATNAYLLGGRPTIGDFGLIGPMYGHLGRDPWPRRELIAPRPHVRAWIDRMAQTHLRILASCRRKMQCRQVSSRSCAYRRRISHHDGSHQRRNGQGAGRGS